MILKLVKHRLSFGRMHKKMNKIEVINFFSENYSCRKCFNNPNISKSGQLFSVADVPGPQPRWLGDNYFNADKKICIILINPGSGNKTPENEWAPLKKMNRAKSPEIKERFWNELMLTNKVGMPKWGAWEKLYFESLGLDRKKNDIAFMNMMLCASKGNAYNPKSLDLCFSLQSRKLLSLLSPDVLIFSGKDTMNNALKKKVSLTQMRERCGSFSREIRSSLIRQEIKDCLQDNTKFYFMGHYAYIKNEDHEDANIISNSIL